MNTTSHYVSPFNAYDHFHEIDDPLCLSRLHHADHARATWDECLTAVQMLCEKDGADQFALWAVRHLVELGLKQLIRRHTTGHDLEELLDQATGFDVDAEGLRLGEFVRDLHRIDPKGDACRYGYTSDGNAALEAVCCVERSQLLSLAEDFFVYIEGRLGRLKGHAATPSAG